MTASLPHWPHFVIGSLAHCHWLIGPLPHCLIENVTVMDMRTGMATPFSLVGE